jgi:hypothetical protein
VASLPPSPLAAIFSDPFGLVPISQPIITDGFGHYDFYTTPGVYTVVVGLGGVTQQVYPDQSVGGGTQGGGTALALQVNGAPTTNQLLANFRGAGSVTISADSLGDITITGASLALQTNSTANALQSVLNLKSGTAIILVPDGVGGVTFNSTASGLAVPFFLGPGVTTNAAATQSGGVSFVANNGQVAVFEFFLPGSITIHQVSVSRISGSAGVMSFGIYSLAGSLLVDSGVFNHGSAAVLTNAITPVVLPSGSYYFAQAGTSGTLTVQGLSAQTEGFIDMSNVSANLAATAANAYNGTNLPATLGAITAMSVSTYGGITYPIFS